MLNAFNSCYFWEDQQNETSERLTEITIEDCQSKLKGDDHYALDKLVERKNMRLTPMARYKDLHEEAKEIVLHDAVRGKGWGLRETCSVIDKNAYQSHISAMNTALRDLA